MRSLYTAQREPREDAHKGIHRIFRAGIMQKTELKSAIQTLQNAPELSESKNNLSLKRKEDRWIFEKIDFNCQIF